MRRIALTWLVLLAAWTFPATARPASDVLFPNDDGAPEGCAESGPAGVERGTDPGDVPLDETVVVSPPRIEVERVLASGDSFTCVLTIRSRRDHAATFQLEPLGVVGSRARNARFEFVGPDDERFGSTAGSWIEPLEDEVTIPPRGVARIPVTVTVPADPPVGSAYGSIDVVSRTRAGAGETVVGVETHVAAVFLLRVGGDGAPELRLRDVEAPRLRWSREPWRLTADLDNDGTLHADAAGRVRVRSIFGNTVTELPIRAETVLPGGRSAIDVRWTGVPWFGLYRYDVRMSDGDEVARAGGWFLALPPWWVLVLIVVLVLALVAYAVGRRRHAGHPDDVDEWDVEHDESN